MKRRIALAAAVIFAVFFMVVEVLGNLTWHLSPRDPAAMEEAGRFQALLGSLVHTSDAGLPGSVSRKSEQVVDDAARLNVSRSYTFQAVHSVEEWKDRSVTFSEAPMLADRVRRGELPQVDERVPKEPLVIVPPDQNGPYGGVWNRMATGPKDINIVEARFAYESLVRWGPKGKEILPNVARKWEISEEGKVFTFWLREGMRWSDGHPYTVDDILFWRNEILLNTDITPVVIREFKRGGEPVEVEKVSDTVFRFRFKEPHGLFMKALASGRGIECAREPAHFLKKFLPKFVGQALRSVPVVRCWNTAISLQSRTSPDKTRLALDSGRPQSVPCSNGITQSK